MGTRPAIASRAALIAAGLCVAAAQQQYSFGPMPRTPIEVFLQQRMESLAERNQALESRMAAIESRLQRHEDSGSNAATERNIAVLEIKVDAIARAATWLLAGMGTMLLGGFAFLMKRVIWPMPAAKYRRGEPEE